MQTHYTGNHHAAAAPEEEFEEPKVRHVPPPILALGRSIRDWWRDMYVMGISCLAWGLLSLTIVLGPPAWAAINVMARASALHEQPDAALFKLAIRTYFWRSWALGLVGLAGIIVWLVDLGFYINLLGGLGIAGWLGAVLIFYIGIAWMLTLVYAWQLLICRDDLKLHQILRNAALIALRFPAHSTLMGVVIFLLGLASFIVPALVVLVTPAIVALLGFHNLSLTAPELVPDEREAMGIVA